MTLHKPTILVDRLVVKRNGNSVMDISFHAGLNVITGENSSGKTTAIRFIAYALGSESISFNQMAQLCDDIYLEITANEAVVTLRRHVSTQLMQPLSIFWGGMQAALDAGASMWQQCPFKRSESKESLSQVMFRLLEMPELRGEGGSNSCTSMSYSRSLIARDSGDCSMCGRSAARAKCNSSATAMK